MSEQQSIFRGGVIEHLPARGLTVIEWRRRRLVARHQPAFEPGSQVTWTIDTGEVVPAEPGCADVNCVQGTVASVTGRGDRAIVALDAPKGRPPVHMSLPADQAPPVGSAVTFRFLPDGIRLMPADRIDPNYRIGLANADTP